MESGSLASINDFLKKLSMVDMFAGACTLVAVSISGYQITRHLLHFNEQKIQLQIIRILVIIPVSFTTLYHWATGVLYFDLPFHHVCLGDSCVQYSARHLRGVCIVHFHAAPSPVSRWRELTCHPLGVQTQDQTALALAQTLTLTNQQVSELTPKVV